MLAIGADAGQRIQGFLTEGLVEAFLHELCIAEDRRERSPQLVAHVGHKLVPVLAGDLEVLDGLGKLACACLHLFEEPGVLNGNHRLVCGGGGEVICPDERLAKEALGPAEGLLEVTPLHPISVKGLGARVSTRGLTPPAPASRSRALLAGAPRWNIPGRSHSTERAFGRGQVFTVIGGSGVGKSCVVWGSSTY